MWEDRAHSAHTLPTGDAPLQTPIGTGIACSETFPATILQHEQLREVRISEEIEAIPHH